MERKTIKLSEILSDIENGLTRKEIREKYSLSKADMEEIFKNPMLKKAKPRKRTANIIDDLTNNENINQ